MYLDLYITLIYSDISLFLTREEHIPKIPCKTPFHRVVFRNGRHSLTTNTKTRGNITNNLFSSTSKDSPTSLHSISHT